MARQKQGSIVNIGSIQGMVGPTPSLYEGTNLGTPAPDYFFHKGGMINMTRYFASMLGANGVRVNCVSPGGFFTGQPEPFLSRYCQKTMLGRMADENDLGGPIVFLLSDFLAGDYQDALTIASRRHDMVGIHVYDQRDKELPPVGLIQAVDAETGGRQWVDAADKRVQQYYTQQFLQHTQYCRSAFLKSGAELVSVRTDEDYVKALQTFFLNRA